ncbi:DUF4159 domain-containing protein [Falsihalocynthiibacter sp. S25ZX9]|uniref:DUF4159 domain-containing protein n=1 Tax=Falsihalocynthiibacter sp. S25ZX9 TaxID=3240870 RepID=UPI00350FB48B
MFTLGPLGFAQPAFLLALVFLPILWWLLRAVPPAPVIRKFPAVGLLLGLKDDENQTDRTPWWLLVLRIFALAAAIIAFAGPLLNPQSSEPGENRNLLIVADASWASAPGWSSHQDRLQLVLKDAARNGNLVAFLPLTDVPTTPLLLESAENVLTQLPSMAPRPWFPDDDSAIALVDAFAAQQSTPMSVLWMSDGLERAGRGALLASLEDVGPVRVYEGAHQTLALGPVSFETGEVLVPILRKISASDLEIQVNAIGPDPSGTTRVLAQSLAYFEAGQTTSETRFDMPPEIRNRITQFSIAGHVSAGAVVLTDEALKRREVALFSSGSEDEALALLDPLHYLRQALVPTADLVDGLIAETLLARPDVVILADVAQLSEGDSAALEGWVKDGGLLVRFAGPRLAASDVSRSSEDPLMPVRLRVGGRSIGGAMSWGEPRGLKEFPTASPFFGLKIPSDVVVNSQVVAEPDPSLASRVLASLEDGTPLVTRKELGDGQVVLFHVTASAQWSSLPISGLFVQMMERLAISSQASRPTEEDLAGTIWSPVKVLDGFGQLIPPPSTLAGIKGEILASALVSAALPPGLYVSDKRQIARNTIAQDQTLQPQVWPSAIPVDRGGSVEERSLKGVLLGLSLVALLLDVIASLWVSGRFHGTRTSSTIAVFATLFCVQGIGAESWAQTASQTEPLTIDEKAFAATSETVMAYVITGDEAVDEVSRAGLWGLGRVLFQRTSIEPADPIAIDLEKDELSFYPMIYWPITTTQTLPSPAAYARLNRYLQKGGLILFDTRDADEQRYKRVTENTRKLRMFARQLDIPPLEEVPSDHVLNRSFYLLEEAAGRYVGPPVWVEAAPADVELAEGMPFRNLNDGVTPVVIGANDWAAAWAIAPNGNRLFTVGRGRAGDEQREMAYRFGVNLMMHVLTGNYKSDQVHVPELLERLGQ